MSEPPVSDLPPRPAIRGQVAQLLTARELVINRGSVHGVARGMYFAVLDALAQDITDPETGQSLGSIFRPKVYVRVTRVEERLAVAATFETQRVNIGGSGLGLTGIAGLFEPPRYVTRYTTFKTADAPRWESIDEAESYVRAGDPVEEVSAAQANATPPTARAEQTTPQPESRAEHAGGPESAPKAQPAE